MDISRDAYDRRKHWDGLRVHQGSVATDDDFNESDVITKEDRRRERVDVIGPAGSPDAGFQIASPVVTNGTLDFTLTPGSMYVGGLRCEVDGTETYQTQVDWLQQPRDDISSLVETLPAPPTGGTRTDLAYLEVWQQPVSAVEDGELFEVALGGPDTSSRMRTMRRVRVLEGVSGQPVTCASAWTALTTALGTLDRGNELVSDANLVVTPVAGAPGDLCTPSTVTGYLGAENQAIRVQLVDATTLTWGFDNASPVYRVQLSAFGTDASGNTTATVGMLTLPRDEVHWPVSGQVVEVLGWSAVLADNEKVAEAVGVLARVTTSYDPSSSSFAIAAPASDNLATFGAAWSAWNARAGAHLDASDPTTGTGKAQVYLYLRVWNRGADVTSPLAIPFVNQPVTLGDTGLQIAISGTTFRPGDFWVIAARPDSPSQVVPWALQNSGRGPTGIRRFYAPLGLLQWSGSTVTAHDCRPTFPPLTERRGCCSIEVGPTGDYTTIQAGVDALPDDGGEICIAPGTYTENVLITGKQHVVIHGCGKRTKLVAPDGSVAAAMQIIDCNDLEIRDLAVRATEGPGILLGLSLDGTSNIGKAGDKLWKSTAVRDLGLEGLRISARDQSGICASNIDHAHIEGCVVELRRLAVTWDAPDASGAGAWPGIYLHGDSIVVDDCRVEVGSDIPAIARPFGGVQVAGDSSHVAIIDCEILRGSGNGITVGSIGWVNDKPSVIIRKPSFGGQIGVSKGCITIGPGPGNPGGPGGGTLTPIADGPIVDLRIVGNDILEMGGSGIGVIAFFSDYDGDGNTDEVVEVDYLTVEDNRIADCLQTEHASPSDDAGESLVVGYGGISLDYVVGLDVSRNDIRGNGASHLAPACGIYANSTAGVSITDNRIRANGPRSAGTRGLLGGGIVLGYAAEPIPGSAFGELFGKAPVEPITGDPALRVSGNVVTTPSGPALVVWGAGQFAITDNQLSSYGFEVTEDLPAYVVYLSNFGGPADVIGWVDVGEIDNEIGDETDGEIGIFKRALGDTMFNDNQVRLLRTQAELHSPAAATAISIFVTSDLAFENNQIVCEAPNEMRVGTRLSANRSLRAIGNNFEDSTNVGYSAATLAGAMNTTSLNQSTHCIIHTTDGLMYAAGNLVANGKGCDDDGWHTNPVEVYGRKELAK
jgi:hypothetical protein|nr:DUF6519 domain-containing protein [Kofleriaceae bacterium]